MVGTTEEVLQKEHLLAQKAQGILEHQQELKTLNHQKKMLKQEQPTTEKLQLTYKESIEFGEQVKKYEENLQQIEIQLQKVRRELHALKLQAKKLLPVTGIKIKVSTYSDDDSPIQVFCVEYIKSAKANGTEGQFQIQPLKG
ncbi:hypothetical protein SAMN05443144_13220 [Fodinibius roseus]|uniref:Uncharacterized protein n=1 Tax=Fodinibius roseus TaxID=1194090 RepID=A0A1M5KHX4_9BACT|nr:hypothetical protein [Fodinibius roseus]SHG52436.1 hypothetical protein SAMN05443144_13220 [Fodinibius roseus]